MASKQFCREPKQPENVSSQRCTKWNLSNSLSSGVAPNARGNLAHRTSDLKRLLNFQHLPRKSMSSASPFRGAPWLVDVLRSQNRKGHPSGYTAPGSPASNPPTPSPWPGGVPTGGHARGQRHARATEVVLLARSVSAFAHMFRSEVPAI